MDLVKNAIGRLVPTKINGFAHEPYEGAFADLPDGPDFVAPTVKSQGQGASKIASSLEALVDAHVPDGGWISFPHYYRDDPTGLRLVVDALRKAGRKDVKILGVAFFNSHADVLLPAFQDGTLGGIEGNVYGAMAKAVASGKLLPWVGLGRTHGGRARAFQLGERVVDLAIAPVPIADRWGNANGVMGHPASMCGPISLFEPDSRWARHSVLLAETIHPGVVVPHPIDMRHIDYVVPVRSVGTNKGIATGTTDIRRVSGDPVRTRIARNVLDVMEAAEVVREGFNFQAGAGAGLIVLGEVLRKMRALGIRGGFTVGGSMEFHVDLLQEGLFELFLDGQCFGPSLRLFESLRSDPRHVEVSTSLYYSPSAKQATCGLMDAAVLGASEVDIAFNVNTITGYDGILRTGIGGGPDAAAGAKLAIFALPMARANRDGRSCPCVRERVTTVVSPGEVVDVVVSEDCVAVNPASRSPYVQALRDNATKVGLDLVSIEEMAARSRRMAEELGPLMDVPELSDEVVFAVEWRDGRLIDSVFRPVA